MSLEKICKGCQDDTKSDRIIEHYHKFGTDPF